MHLDISRLARSLLPAALPVALAACGGSLPPGTTSFTVGRTVVRTDSVLDLVGIVWRLADTSKVPVRGPVRHWLEALQTELSDSAFTIAAADSPVPASLLLETWAQPDVPDTACGFVEPGRRLCFTGNAPVRREVVRLIHAAESFGPRAAPIALEGVNAAARLRDLGDVYVALTKGKSLDSAVAAYAGWPDLSFDVTLARTVPTLTTTPSLDPARPSGAAHRLFLTPDDVFPERSYRSPTYVWLALSHQMAHEVVRRLFAARPDLLAHGWKVREAVAPEMARVGYTGLFWDDALGEQLARAIAIRIMQLTSPTLTWAMRSEASNFTDMALVPWLEDLLQRYEKDRRTWPDLASFAGVLGAALDSIPLDSCRAAPEPGLGLVGVARHRARVGWLAPGSPFRAKGLLPSDTVIALDGDSVAGAGGLLTPTRQLILKWANHLPFELAELSFKRGAEVYGYSVPIVWGPRMQVRVASQARTARAPGEELPICRWVRRAVRP